MKNDEKINILIAKYVAYYEFYMQIEIPSKKLFTSIAEFRFLKELGVGSFGKVKLAVHKGTHKKYAIKVISKFPIISDLTSDLKET